MIAGLLEILRRGRYVVNLDAAEKARVKKIFSIGEDETIQVVLDDSPFKNLKQCVLLTDKKVYWNISKAQSELRSGETLITTKGSGFVTVESLKTASVFVRDTDSGTVIHIIDADKWIRLTLKWFENSEVLRILFYYYLSRSTPAYNPNHGANEEQYRRYVKEHRGKSVSVIPLIYDIFNYALSGVLLLNLAIPRFTGGEAFAAVERIVFFSVMVKLAGILCRYRKSAYMNSLLIVAISCFMMLPDLLPHVDRLPLTLVYAALSALFSVFDFDRIFKYLVFALAVAAAVALCLQLFYLGPLF
ncbi:MAG: hypothetical protein LBD96_04625 [Treponema sp.]|jgi:hypothetical protein|nr:hypothetical protein [Treponema sp.]